MLQDLWCKLSIMRNSGGGMGSIRVRVIIWCLRWFVCDCRWMGNINWGDVGMGMSVGALCRHCV